MATLISVVDLTSGALASRDRATLTLDIPPDFDRNTGGVFVDADKLGRYRTPEGQTCVYATRPQHLSDRAPGEECLVATEQVDTGGAACTRRYWLSVVEPRPETP